MTRVAKTTLALGFLACLLSGTASATVFDGTLYYTDFAGFQNVNKVSFSYDDSGSGTFSVGSQVNVAHTPGADGIIFAPNGNLLVGGQGTNAVYEVDPTTGNIVQTHSLSDQSYHLTLDPTGTKFYTSNFGGPLDTVPLPTGSGTLTGVTGDDSGVTQLAFTPGGPTFYVDGQPNGNGNVGTIDVTTGVTSRIFTDLLPAHGMIYDPFTQRVTLFGDGAVGTFDPLAGANIATTLKTRTNINCDFDQGAVDGHGHALIAGCNQVTFIDYSLTGDITSSLNRVFYASGFDNIDDVSPLVGAGSQEGTPEPGTLAVIGAGLAGLFGLRRRRA